MSGAHGLPLLRGILFRIIVVLIFVALWPIFLPGCLRVGQPLIDDLKNNPAVEELKELFNAMNDLCEEGDVEDEIQHGHGLFGHAVTNPIPTNTLLGSMNYLARLRTLDGFKVIYTRKCSLTDAVSPRPIDAYSIFHPEGSALATLYFSPYHKRNSRKAPKGFTLGGTFSG